MRARVQLPESASGLYYLQDARTYVGNCVYWWAVRSAGYTCHLDRAGLYTYEEADSRVNGGDPGRTVAWPADVVQRAASLTVDIQILRRLSEGA